LSKLNHALRNAFAGEVLRDVVRRRQAGQFVHGKPVAIFLEIVERVDTVERSGEAKLNFKTRAHQTSEFLI
jgi:hypothetical protein